VLAPIILTFEDRVPEPDQASWIAPGAIVVGDVRIGANASVWYGAVVRADEERIEIGARSNVQDNCVIHADPGFPAIIGADVTIGHNATIHGAVIGDGVLIGMGSVLLNGCTIGAGSIIGAGSVVPENFVVPPRSLVLGLPARIKRELTDDEVARNLESARGYQRRAERHRRHSRP
jgi:carbonic anhydrase/acetyltransferase-like protein (isoleucine patch superfamily)